MMFPKMLIALSFLLWGGPNVGRPLPERMKGKVAA
jgi:hypothetical protein